MARRIVLRRRHFGMRELQPFYLLVTTVGSQLVVAFSNAALEALDAQCRKTCMIGTDYVFEHDVPDYYLRRFILLRDPPSIVSRFSGADSSCSCNDTQFSNVRKPLALCTLR